MRTDTRYALPAMEWRVRLDGDPSDLWRLSEDLRDSDLTVVRDDKTSFYLTSSSFEAMREDFILRAAEARLSLLNGIARLSYQSHRKITLAGIEMVNKDGSRRSFGVGFAAGHSRAVGHGVAIRNGVPAVNPAPTQAQRYASLSRDERVARILRLLGTDTSELTWPKLYNIYEIIEAECGGAKGIAARGWAALADMKCLTWTANSVTALGDEARHGVENTDPPPRPMLLRDAINLVRCIAVCWLDSKSQP